MKGYRIQKKFAFPLANIKMDAQLVDLQFMRKELREVSAWFIWFNYKVYKRVKKKKADAKKKKAAKGKKKGKKGKTPSYQKKESVVKDRAQTFVTQKPGASLNIITPKGATGKEADNFSATVAHEAGDSLVSQDGTSDADFTRTMQPVELGERLGEDGEEDNEDLDQIKEAKDGDEEKDDNTSMKDVAESPGPKVMLDADGNEIDAPVI